MQVAIINNGAVEQIGDYRELFLNVSFPSSGPDAAWMAENNVVGVTVWKAHDGTQKLIPCEPYLEDGQVFTVRVEDKTDDELAAEAAASTAAKAATVRAERNRKLSESDWTQLADAPVNREAWLTYRQALRDLTAQDGFPFDAVWPEPPTV